VLKNAIRFPSGDQAGSPSNAGLFVNCRCALLSEFITKISEFPVRKLVNAISPFTFAVAGCEAWSRDLLRAIADVSAFQRNPGEKIRKISANLLRVLSPIISSLFNGEPGLKNGGSALAEQLYFA